ncbi:MAG: PKD domain-containing protein [Desulfobacterales bacterium]|nr:PKD domain-containing protein [Desulfobacterales bacterium]
MKKTGMTWSIPEELYSITTTTDAALIGSRWFSDFHIAVDSNNYPHFTWVYGGPQTAFPDCTGKNEHEIYYMFFNGTSWENPINVSDNSTNSSFCSIAVDSQNNVHFVWRDGQTYLSTGCDSTGTSALYHRQKYADGSWSSVSPVISVDYYGSYPAISRGQGGEVHLAYSVQAALEYVFWNGSVWSTPVLLSSEGDNYYDKDICVDGDNTIHIVYNEWNNSEFEHQIKYIVFDGSEWSVPVKLSDADNGYSKIPSIAVSSDNSPQTVWYQDTPSYSKLFYTQKVSSNWTSLVQISTTGTYPQETSFNTLSAAISKDDILHVVWQSYYDGGNEVYYNYADINDDQTDPEVAIIAPVAGETLNADTTYPIIWSAVDNTGVADIEIEYSIDEGSTFETIVLSAENTGSYLWRVPEISSDSVQIYITATDFAGNQFTGVSDQFAVSLADSDIQADFTSGITNGPAPLSVSFTDQSTGNITSWLWIFGDGATSTEQEPVHEYNTPGNYTVSLTVSGPDVSDTETKADFIAVDFPAPVAAFSASITSGPVPLNVGFTDESTGNITSWSWDFGDGASSTFQNPVNNYTVPGLYTVTLTITGPGGFDTATVTDYILVQADADGDSLSDQFENASCTDVNDADTDNDGIVDGDEYYTFGTNPCEADTDGDGIQDGTELGVTSNDIGPGTDTDVFQPDIDPSTTTDPLLADSDGDGVTDGQEDTNHNGLVDGVESDPNDPLSNHKGDIDGDGDVDQDDVSLALQVLSGKNPSGIRSNYATSGADVNGDGRIGMEEVIYIKEKISSVR